jgi:hypothetical protein
MFFVISGFIMSYITFTTRFEPRRWLLSRFFRIFLMYMFFTGLVMMLWLYNPSMTMGSGEHDWRSVMLSMLIIPQADLPLLFVGWTVEHEIVFYTTAFLVARFMPVQWLFAVTLTLSALSICKRALQVQGLIQFWDFHIFSLYTIQFTMGALVYRFWSEAAGLEDTVSPVRSVSQHRYGFRGLRDDQRRKADTCAGFRWRLWNVAAGCTQPRKAATHCGAAVEQP